LIVPIALIVPIHLTILCLLAIAVGACLLLRGLVLLVRWHRQHAPASKIASALPGLAEVHGVANGPNTITAPIAGKPCYLYRTTVWQQRKAASHEWERIAAETLHVPFFLDDSTGELLIEPLGADLELPSEFHKEYDPALFLEQNKVPPSVSLFLARHGVTPARRIRIEECCVCPESAIFVAGTVTENPGVEVRPISHSREDTFVPGRLESTGQLRGADTPEVIRLSVSTAPQTADAMTQQSRIAAALVKARIQSPDAWAAAGVPYPETGRGGEASDPPLNGKREAPPSEPSLMPALVLMKGPEGTPFRISWRSLQELGRAYVWQSALMLGVGTALAFAGFGVLVKTHLL